MLQFLWTDSSATGAYGTGKAWMSCADVIVLPPLPPAGAPSGVSVGTLVGVASVCMLLGAAIAYLVVRFNKNPDPEAVGFNNMK